jgi:hypothetical protein
MPHNNSMQLTALRAAGDAGRWAGSEPFAFRMSREAANERSEYDMRHTLWAETT